MVSYQRPAYDYLHAFVVAADKLDHLVDGQVHHVEGRRDCHADRVEGEVIDQPLFLLLKQVYVLSPYASLVEVARQIRGGEIRDLARPEPALDRAPQISPIGQVRRVVQQAG